MHIGCDVVDLAVLARQVHSPAGTQLLRRILTDNERDYCLLNVDRIGGRWAAKEAVAKAVGCGWQGLRPTQVEISRDDRGRPLVRANGAEPWPDDAHLWAWAVSIAHDGPVALAVAVANEHH